MSGQRETRPCRRRHRPANVPVYYQGQREVEASSKKIFIISEHLKDEKKRRILYTERCSPKFNVQPTLLLYVAAKISFTYALSTTVPPNSNPPHLHRPLQPLLSQAQDAPLDNLGVLIVKVTRALAIRLKNWKKCEILFKPLMCVQGCNANHS